MSASTYVVEIATRSLDEDTIDTILDALADHSPVAARTSTGLPSIILTLPAQTLRAAATTAHDLLAPHLTPLTLTAMPTTQWDQQEGLDRDTEMLSVADAAQHLGVDRTTITRMINRGDLPGARKIGRAWLVPRRALLPADSDSGAPLSI